MIILFTKKYFFLLLINIFIIITSNYSYASNDRKALHNINDTITHNLNGESFIKKLPDSILNCYKKDPMIFNIPANELFSEPLQLLILQDLIKTTVEVFNKFKVVFWISENTFLDYLKFNSLAPWSDNVTFSIDYKSLKNNIKSITNALKRQGIEFDEFKHIKNLKYIPYLRFTTKKLFDVIKKYEPSFLVDDIAKKYVQLKYKCIQINLYPFAISQTGGYNLIEYLHDVFVRLGGSKIGYDIKDIYPLQQVKLNDIVVNVIKNPYAMLEIKQDLDDIYSVYVGNSLCTYASSIQLKDIRKYCDFLEIINSFLTFTFKEQFHGMSKTYQDILNK